MRICTAPLMFSVVLCGLLFASPGKAQDYGSLNRQGSNPVELILVGITDTAASAWAKTKAAIFGETPGDLKIAPATPMDAVRDIHNPGGSAFWDHLSDAGYKFKELVTEVGIIPGIEFEFVIARELSEADRNALERTLEIDAKQNPGFFAAIQREIVWTLLEASEVKGMRIEELTVTMLPLPGVEFVLAPAEGPMSEEHDTLYRNIKDLKRYLKEQEEKTQDAKKLQ